MADEDRFTPRNYQVQLMEIALKQNTIIYLPTGSGKTFIALMVVKAMSESLLTSYNDGGKITVILVNSVPLVDQHAKYIKDHTVLSVGCYTGEMKLDYWSREHWIEEFNKYKVLIMTAQIMLNILEANYLEFVPCLLCDVILDLERTNLIIFDECHQGVIDHPMRQIMKTFQNCPSDRQPRVLGLTATLLNGNCQLNKVMAQVKNLETTFHGTVATVDELNDVIGFSTNPQELFRTFKKAVICPIQQFAFSLLEHTAEVLGSYKIEPTVNNRNVEIEIDNNLLPLDTNGAIEELIKSINQLTVQIAMLGVFGGYKACISHMILFERLRKHCGDVRIFFVLNYLMTILGTIKEYFNRAMSSFSERDRIYKFSSDQVLVLFKILEEYKMKSKEELCALIFVQMRFTAKLLHHILAAYRRVNQDMNYIRSNFIVGYANNPNKETRESLFITKKNKEILDMFVNKEINVLVASKVLEEGVDIPKCTLVIKFDKSEDYRSYIQSKGRARHRLSLYYTMVPEEKLKSYVVKYEEFGKIEGLLNDFLVGKSQDRPLPGSDQISDMYNEDVQPYFVNGPNSASVTILSAISLLSRYCQSLPSDEYTTYAPDWYWRESTIGNRKLVQVVIILPIVCPILKPIEGPHKSNKKDAKRAAALKACIALHKCGELNDDLLPVKVVLHEEKLLYLFPHWPETSEPGAGNKKNRRLHKKQIANCIKGPLKADTNIYLHIINFQPEYIRGEEYNNQVIYDLLTSKRTCFGILTPHPLPKKLCNFPIYDSKGSIEIQLLTNVKTIRLTSIELQGLRDFHFLLFDNLLQVLRPYLYFDNSGKNSESLLIVPIDNSDSNQCEILFDFVNQFKTLKEIIEPSALERRNIDVDEEDYLHKIVTPWYRNQQSTYVVTRVCLEKSPMSPFPNEDFTNFKSYFEDKHSLRTYNLDQPLLLVKGISHKLNVYKPRGVQGKRKRDKRYEELEENLIPEHVIKQDFPSTLWVQSRFLPTILNRLTFLLKLHQLQKRIATDLNLNFDENYCPKLELDLHLLHFEPSIMDEKPKLPTNLHMTVRDDLLPIESSLTPRPQYNKDYALKKLEAEFPWKTIEEPKDIERLLEVSIMDIDHYENFISQAINTSNVQINESPSKAKALPAITYPIDFIEKDIEIISIVYKHQCPNLCEIYRALSAAEANDIVNLERLEILGDSFLKFISSIYILLKFPDYNEGLSTTLKGRLVSNKNLFYLAQRFNLGGTMRTRDFSPKEEWLPPCFSVPISIQKSIINKEYSVNSLFYLSIPREEQISGQLSKETMKDFQESNRVDVEEEEDENTSMSQFINQQYVSDKSVADAMEALLGAYFLSGGIVGGIKFVEWIGLIPKSERLENLIEKTDMNPLLDPSSVTQKQIDFHIPQWNELENRLDYHFKNRAFLLQALTHSSYSPNRITKNYERLEFIGDAILDFLITCYIYENCGNLSPGEVTDLRSALVNNNTFASLVVRSGFQKFLLMINSKLQSYIDKFTKYFEAKNYVIDDEILILLEEKDLNSSNDLNIAEHVDVPKVLGDLFEALAGAVYLDSGKDLNTVWRVFYKLMWREIDLFSKNVPKNVLRKLYECTSAYAHFSKPREIENEQTMVYLEYMCDGLKKNAYGFGSNKLMAKRAAAKIALRALKL